MPRTSPEYREGYNDALEEVVTNLLGREVGWRDAQIVPAREAIKLDESGRAKVRELLAEECRALGVQVGNMAFPAPEPAPS